MKRIEFAVLIPSLLLPLIVGGIAAAISGNAMASYGEMAKPPLSPPAWVFPVAWTILYLLMGIAFYFILITESSGYAKAVAIGLYLIQLFMNFMWPIIFFKWEQYLAALILLVALWAVVIFCTFRFFGISKIAGWLMIPYILWLTFAAYLNLGTLLISLKA